MLLSDAEYYMLDGLADLARYGCGRHQAICGTAGPRRQSIGANPTSHRAALPDASRRAQAPERCLTDADAAIKSQEDTARRALARDAKAAIQAGQAGAHAPPPHRLKIFSGHPLLDLSTPSHRRSTARTGCSRASTAAPAAQPPPHSPRRPTRSRTRSFSITARGATARRSPWRRRSSTSAKTSASCPARPRPAWLLITWLICGLF